MYLGFTLKTAQKRLMAEPAAVSRYFKKKRKNFCKIDLPSSIHTNFQTEIRILSALRALITKVLHSTHPLNDYTCGESTPIQMFALDIH